jgi:hypothetical protein
VRWVALQAPGGGSIKLSREDGDEQEDEDEDEARGEVELAIELLPAELAAKRPAGDGRSDPNQNPSLPEPDRMSLLALASPLGALKRLVGPEAVKFLICGACCVMVAMMLPLILSNVISHKIDALTG